MKQASTYTNFYVVDLVKIKKGELLCLLESGTTELPRLIVDVCNCILSLVGRHVVLELVLLPLMCNSKQ